MKIYFFCSNKEDKRLTRFLEESELLGIKALHLNPYNCQLTNDGVFFDDKRINFKKKDKVWFISNTAVNHKLIAYIEDKVAFIWPNSVATKLSDKWESSVFFQRNMIMTPKTIFLSSLLSEKIQENVKYVGGFPCVIKMTRSSLGRDVKLVNSVEEIIFFIKDILGNTSSLKLPIRRMSFVLQQFIAESSGTDFRVICLKNKLIGTIMRKSEVDFRANISLGGRATNVEVDNELKKMCHKIMKKGNLFYAGLDFVKSKDGFLAIEINTSSQFEGFESVTGKNVARLILKELA